MDARDIKLLGNAAVRFEGGIGTRAENELRAMEVLRDDEFPDIDDIRRIFEDSGRYGLSVRMKETLAACLKSETRIRRAAEHYAELADKYNIQIICRTDDDYPFVWRYMSGMPPVIFLRGKSEALLDITYKGAAGIVGSREPGRYARYATRQFSENLSRRGTVIVSGLAKGIDRDAHEACLDAGGETIAVTAGGVDVIYPYQNKDVYDRIISEGAVIAELPPGVPVVRQYFPSRNRLISGISDVCLIMQAGEFSGTLHTASFAGAQGKDVFVLPNSIYAENSLGGLMLLRDGAEVLIDTDTVYMRIQGEVENRKAMGAFVNSERFDDTDKRKNPADLWKLQKDNPEALSDGDWMMLILDELSERPKRIDSLFEVMNIKYTKLSSYITELERAGCIYESDGKYVLTIKGR